jgi:catechol 2,3-dioxygenase-like lactoylglutathione lyase family enzyme
VRIREVVLPAADPDALTDFYSLPAPGGGVAFGASRVRFSPGPAVCSHFAVNVPSERFEEAVAWARDRVTLLNDDVPFPEWRARSAYFFDSGGNIVELIARERAPGEELFLEVSEVGLPVRDVGVAVDWLVGELGLPHFDGDRRSFSAVGDERGLFIVVPVGRPWLFTEEPAPEAAVRVTIEPDLSRSGRGRPSRVLARRGELTVPGSEHVVKLGSL